MNHQQNQAVSNILTSGTCASGRSFQDEVAVVKAVEAVDTCFWSSAHINNYALYNFSNWTSAHAQYDGFTVSCKSIAISLIIKQNRNSVCQICRLHYVLFIHLCLFVGISLGCCVWR